MPLSNPPLSAARQLDTPSPRITYDPDILRELRHSPLSNLSLPSNEENRIAEIFRSIINEADGMSDQNQLGNG